MYIFINNSNYKTNINITMIMKSYSIIWFISVNIIIYKRINREFININIILALFK